MSKEEYLITWVGIPLGVALSIVLLIGVPTGIWAFFKNVQVWSATKTGEAELARAEANRQIITAEAKAKKEAAKFVAEADVIRAQGIAKANKLIGESLERNDKYLVWKFIDELSENKNQIIYLPSNQFLPITEANRAKGK